MAACPAVFFFISNRNFIRSERALPKYAWSIQEKGLTRTRQEIKKVRKYIYIYISKKVRKIRKVNKHRQLAVHHCPLTIFKTSSVSFSPNAPTLSMAESSSTLLHSENYQNFLSNLHRDPPPIGITYFNPQRPKIEFHKALATTQWSRRQFPHSSYAYNTNLSLRF